MEHKELSLGMQIGKTMHSIVKVMKKRYNELSGESLTMDQFGILHAIKIKDEEVILKDMADMIGKDKSAILRKIDSLEEKGMIRRVEDKIDRRRNFLMITKRGEKVIQDFFEIEKKLAQELLEGISEEDLQTFYKVMNHITDNAMNK